MPGYNLGIPKYQPETEETWVGCRNCSNTWYEMHTHTTPARINGVMRIYDACDKCYDIELKKYK